MAKQYIFYIYIYQFYFHWKDFKEGKECDKILDVLKMFWLDEENLRVNLKLDNNTLL